MKMTQKVRIIAGATFLALTLSFPILLAHAAGGACADDVKKFCSGVQPRGGRLAQCLKQHEAELSATCKDSLQTMKTQSEEKIQACSNDIKTFCQGVQPRGGRLAQCLKQHEAELSEPCKKAM